MKTNTLTATNLTFRGVSAPNSLTEIGVKPVNIIGAQRGTFRRGGYMM